jgi:F0F1-type ATP synthase membrane subunit a
MGNNWSSKKKASMGLMISSAGVYILALILKERDVIDSSQAKIGVALAMLCILAGSILAIIEKGFGNLTKQDWTSVAILALGFAMIVLAMVNECNTLVHLSMGVAVSILAGSNIVLSL